MGGNLHRLGLAMCGVGLLHIGALLQNEYPLSALLNVFFAGVLLWLMVADKLED